MGEVVVERALQETAERIAGRLDCMQRDGLVEAADSQAGHGREGSVKARIWTLGR